MVFLRKNLLIKKLAFISCLFIFPLDIVYSNKINLIDALKKNYPFSMIKRLISYKNKDQRDKFGNTALHYAVIYNRENVVKALLAKKANFLLINDEGLSAKEIAKKQSNPVINELFRKQIELNRKNKKDFSMIFQRITRERVHCCQFYGQLKKNRHIKILIQKNNA